MACDAWLGAHSDNRLRLQLERFYWVLTHFSIFAGSADENEYLKFKYVMRGARPRYPVGMVTRDERYDAAEPSER